MNSRTVDIYGIPWDEKSSFMRGCRDAPRRIWDAFKSESANCCSESGHDLGKFDHFRFRGNLDISRGNQVIKELTRAAADIDSESRPIFLGGDHAITYPLVKGLSRHYDHLNILHFDAHPDLYDQIYGDQYSHGCPCARILEEKLASRLVSVGIRTMTPHQQSQADRFGAEIIDMLHFDSRRSIEFSGPVYISVDLDVLDPAFAPGISHHEPGGMSTRELLRAIQLVKGEIIGADIVEYNPHRDIDNLTAMVAAKIMKEAGAKILFPAAYQQ